MKEEYMPHSHTPRTKTALAPEQKTAEANRISLAIVDLVRSENAKGTPGTVTIIGMCLALLTVLVSNNVDGIFTPLISALKAAIEYVTGGGALRFNAERTPSDVPPEVGDTNQKGLT
jgi:hypothetical protein